MPTELTAWIHAPTPGETASRRAGKLRIDRNSLIFSNTNTMLLS
jgi:hypothetical protein